MLVSLLKIGGKKNKLVPQAAANRRQGPGPQCYHRSRTSQFDLNGQGRALCLERPYTLLCYPADLCMCHRHILFWEFLIQNFSHYVFTFVVLLTTWSKRRPMPAEAVHQRPRKDLIAPRSITPDTGCVRSSGLGPGPTYNPDPTLMTTRNRARASATDTWPWNIQVALGEWLVWNAARLPRGMRGYVWHILVNQTLAQKHGRQSYTQHGRVT